MVLICEYVYVLLTLFVINLPAPTFWSNNHSFIEVLGHSFRYICAAAVGNIIAGFTNIYFITKWKILVSGKYFWLRSLGASLIAEIILTIIVYTITFWGLSSSIHVINFMVSGFLCKLTFSVIATFPASILVHILKNVEGDVYTNSSVNFNPFRFTLN